jgi:hypothetical protein
MSPRSSLLSLCVAGVAACSQYVSVSNVVAVADGGVSIDGGAPMAAETIPTDATMMDRGSTDPCLALDLLQGQGDQVICASMTCLLAHNRQQLVVVHKIAVEESRIGSFDAKHFKALYAGSSLSSRLRSGREAQKGDLLPVLGLVTWPAHRYGVGNGGPLGLL